MEQVKEMMTVFSFQPIGEPRVHVTFLIGKIKLFIEKTGFHKIHICNMLDIQ